MSSVANDSRINQPVYYHREYSNDVQQDKDKESWVNTCQRVGMVALPFLSLHKSLSFPISLGMGALRTYTCASQLLATIQSGRTDAIQYHLLQTTIAVGALACTIFAHPLGMLITTGQDLIMEMVRLAGHLEKGEYKQAMESCFSIINNALYLALFLRGGLEIAVASLAVQILLGLYKSHSDFLKGNYIEAAGHLGMSMVRGHQIVGQANMLQAKWKMQEPKRLESPHPTKNEPTKLRSKQDSETLTKIQAKNEPAKLGAKQDFFNPRWDWEMAPGEKRDFWIYRWTISIINDTDQTMNLHLFIDEGVPVLEDEQHYLYYDLPNDKDFVFYTSDMLYQ